MDRLFRGTPPSSRLPLGRKPPLSVATPKHQVVVMATKLPSKLLKRVARVFGRKHKRAAMDSDVTAAKPPSPRLPLEIFELIIDFARPDRQTLLACSLTCKAWVHRSRYNLFHNVELRTMDQLAHFSGLVAAESRIGTLVRQLHIAPYRTQAQVFGTFPFVLGGKLTKVDHLRIDIRRDYYPSVYPNFFASISKFSTITTLEVHRTQFPSLNDFGLLVCSFPKLTSLSCWMVSWIRKSFDPQTFKALDRRIQLKYLYVRNVDWSEEMVDWLLLAASVSQLATIVLPVMSVRDVEHVSRLLDAVGSSLRHVEIGVAQQRPLRQQGKAVTNWGSEVGTYPRLIQNTRLTSLHLDLYGGDNWASGLLAQIASSGISEVVLQLPPQTKETKLKYMHCRYIDNSLSLPQFTKLAKLVFQYDANMDDERLNWFRGEISSRFPLAKARRLIEFRGVTREWWESVAVL